MRQITPARLSTSEEAYHVAFKVGIFLKGLHAIIEIVGGIGTLFITKDYVMRLVLSVTREELSEDNNDRIAQYLIHAGNNFSVPSQHFVAMYLLSHGIIKLLLVVGLLRKYKQTYPVAIIVFSFFIAYQVFRFFFTHSWWLIGISLLDALLIWLTVREYRYLKAYRLFVN